MSLTLKKIKKELKISNGHANYLLNVKDPKKNIPHYMFWIYGKNNFLHFSKDIQSQLFKIGKEMHIENTSINGMKKDIELISDKSQDYIIFLAGILIALLGGFISNIVYDAVKKLNIFIFIAISILVVTAFIYFVYTILSFLLDLDSTF